MEMNRLMNLKSVDDYCLSNIHKPFFIVVGDEEYSEVLNALSSRGFIKLRVSECCRREDKVPDLDTLQGKLETADISFNRHNIVVVGLGEYLALLGASKAKAILEDITNLNLGNAHVVLLLRGVASQVKELVKKDKRLLENCRIAISDKHETTVSLKLCSIDLGVYEITGIKNILRALEDGKTGVISANTEIRFETSLIPIQQVNNAYDAITKHVKMDSITKDYGVDSMWEELLKDLKSKGFNIKRLFSERGFDDFQYADFYTLLYGNDYDNWLFYIFLTLNFQKYSGKYLGYCIQTSIGINEFKQHVLTGITLIPRDDGRFNRFYQERKRLLSNYPGAELAQFIDYLHETDANESVYYLTDNTLVEREEVIVWIANHGIPEDLAKIYPSLAAYMKDYSFECEDIDVSLANELANYFKRYKKLKLTNNLSDEFLNQVKKLAVERIYNQLEKRDELVKQKNDGATQLFWIDALGAEYIAFIKEGAERRNLKISIQVGRAELPTLTSLNDNFFKNWPQNLRLPKEERLDEIIHDETRGYYRGSRNLYPVHLASVLDVIDAALEQVSTSLWNKKYRRIVIASDHGSSRLAVLCNGQEKYYTETKGEHSGRCCEYFEGCDSPFVVNERSNGYNVIADYGSFKGGRASNVEVHGGASLEEVVVPIITRGCQEFCVFRLTNRI
jgi:hypothetical protein